MNPIFLSDKAEEGFQTLLADLQKLREKNHDYINKKHLRLLDKVSNLTRIIITCIVALGVIIAVYYITNIRDTAGFQQFIQYLSDFGKLLHLGW